MAIDLSALFPTLTKQQRSVLALVAKGKDNKEIAREMEISPRTVEDYRHDVYVKLGVKNVAGLVYKVFGEPEIVA